MRIRFLKKIAIVLLAVNFMACATLAPAATPTAADIEREEQAIYSFFLVEGEGPALILQETSTNISELTTQEMKEQIKGSFKGVSNAAVESYIERNAQPSQLSPTMELGVEYVFLSREELSEITSQPNWGEVLTGKYPGSYGYTVFSRVGFNNSLDQAVVYVGGMAGPLMGSGFYYLMEKKNGEWLIVEQVMVWIS